MPIYSLSSLMFVTFVGSEFSRSLLNADFVDKAALMHSECLPLMDFSLFPVSLWREA